MVHSNNEVHEAILHLCDALCAWERVTGRQSVLLVYEQGSVGFRAVNGKFVSAEINDSGLMDTIQNWTLMD